MNELKIGWLTPTGELIECTGYEHLSTARDIAAKLGLLKNESRADDDLFNAGFVLIGRWTFLSHGWRIIWGWHHTLTPEQRRFLQPYFYNEADIDEQTLMRWLRED